MVSYIPLILTRLLTVWPCSAEDQEVNYEDDFVYGPIADDKVGFQLRRYKDEVIDKAELLEKLKYMNGITFQYFFGSDAAIKYLTIL